MSLPSLAERNLEVFIKAARRRPEHPYRTIEAGNVAAEERLLEHWKGVVEKDLTYIESFLRLNTKPMRKRLIHVLLDRDKEFWRLPYDLPSAQLLLRIQAHLGDRGVAIVKGYQTTLRFLSMRVLGALHIRILEHFLLELGTMPRKVTGTVQFEILYFVENVSVPLLRESVERYTALIAWTHVKQPILLAQLIVSTLLLLRLATMSFIGWVSNTNFGLLDRRNVTGIAKDLASEVNRYAMQEMEVRLLDIAHWEVVRVRELLKDEARTEFVKREIAISQDPVLLEQKEICRDHTRVYPELEETSQLLKSAKSEYYRQLALEMAKASKLLTLRRASSIGVRRLSPFVDRELCAVLGDNELDWSMIDTGLSLTAAFKLETTFQVSPIVRHLYQGTVQNHPRLARKQEEKWAPFVVRPEDAAESDGEGVEPTEKWESSEQEEEDEEEEKPELVPGDPLEKFPLSPIMPTRSRSLLEDDDEEEEVDEMVLSFDRLLISVPFEGKRLPDEDELEDQPLQKKLRNEPPSPPPPAIIPAATDLAGQLQRDEFIARMAPLLPLLEANGVHIAYWKLLPFLTGTQYQQPYVRTVVGVHYFHVATTRWLPAVLKFNATAKEIEVHESMDKNPELGAYVTAFYVAIRPSVLVTQYIPHTLSIDMVLLERDDLRTLVSTVAEFIDRLARSKGQRHGDLNLRNILFQGSEKEKNFDVYVMDFSHVGDIRAKASKSAKLDDLIDGEVELFIKALSNEIRRTVDAGRWPLFMETFKDLHNRPLDWYQPETMNLLRKWLFDFAYGTNDSGGNSGATSSDGPESDLYSSNESSSDDESSKD